MNAKTSPLFQFLEVGRAEPAKRGAEARRAGYAEIYAPYAPAEAAAQAQRCLSCGNPYCAHACPLHNAIPEWLALAAAGRFVEAAELCHRTNPLPEICGRVCPQDRLCEGACTLHDLSGAVTIGWSERQIVDTAFALGWRPDLSRVVATGKRVAVVGSGPAGLACADVLARAGVAVTVYERQDAIGGLLMFGIPEFKLEKRVLRQRRAIFEAMGIVFELGTEIGRDVAIENLLAEYDAVFLGLGAYRPNAGGFPGEDLPGVHRALDYLAGQIRAQHGLPPTGAGHIELRDKRVVVLGGGDTAMDCVRTALRQGAADVLCVYRRDEANMPGSRREVANAKEEGARFLWRRQPAAIEDCPGGLRLHLTETGADAATEEMLTVDAMILAFGFRPEPPAWLGALGVASDGQGRTLVAGGPALPMQTAHPRLFAGGDAVRGANLVVNAVADGRAAAGGILAYLGL